MPLFRRKTAERQAKPPASIQNVLSGSGLKRTPSNRSNRSLPRSPSTPDSWGEDSDIGLPQSVLNGNPSSIKRPHTLMLSESVLQDGQDIPENSLESPLRTSSRLSKTLLEVVRDKDALSCLKAFMKSQKVEHIIQFWCDAESFHASTLMRLRTHSLQNISKSALHQRRSDTSRHSATDSGSSVGSEVTSESIGGMTSDKVPSSETTHPVSSSNNTNQIEEEDIKTSHSEDHSVANIPQQYQQLASGDSERAVDSNSTHHVPSHPEAPHQKQTGDQPKVPSLDPNYKSLNLAVSSCDTLSATSSAIQASNISCDTTISDTSSSSLGGTEVCSRDGKEHSRLAATRPQQPSTLDINEQTTTGTSNLKSPQPSQEDLALKLKKSIERDAVTIFSTYIAKDAPKPLGVDDTLRSEAISKICKEDGEVDPECFVSCQRFALDKIESGYFQSFMDSEFHCRHQVNVLTTEKVYLPDILLNDNALCYFMEFMEQEGASDLMQMWLAADNFQQQLTSTSGSYDGDQAQTDAMVIYDKYFSLQATNPIGFDDKLRFEIEGNICREGGPLPDCFTKAKNIVLKILEKMYFPNYLQSQVYYRYLSDLISTVQMSEDMPNKSFQKGHRRAASDASSEHSAGSQSTGAESVVSRNTLLAVDTRKLRKVSTFEGDFSMNMDMLNPDDLWKRPGAKTSPSSIGSELSLGSVNELGQFVSKFEHDTEVEKKKGPGLFKRRKEKEKEEEEMALRIAQMIISDVNTMTKTGESMASRAGDS